MTTTPQELIAANYRFKDGVIGAAKSFARSKPFEGTTNGRRAKFVDFHNRLCELYEISHVRLIFMGDNNNNEPSGRSCIAFCDRNTDIVMVGRLSVITYLTLFAESVMSNGDRNKAARFAYNVFQRAFPRSFERLTAIDDNGIVS